MFAVVFIATYLFSSLSQTRNAMDNRNPLQAFLFVVFGIYFVWFWAKGQTLAMKAWDIRVVDLRGNPINQKRALARYALSWLWFLPPLGASWVFGLSAKQGSALAAVWIIVWAVAALFHPRRQFWHDALAGTELITWKMPKTAKQRKQMATSEAGK